MSPRTVLAVIGALLAALAGVHMILAVAALLIAAVIGALGYMIVLVVADSGWRVQPCQRRFAW